MMVVGRVKQVVVYKHLLYKLSLNTCVYTFDIYLTFCSTDVDHENGQKETEMENVCNGVDIIENAEEEIFNKGFRSKLVQKMMVVGRVKQVVV
jgi:hypothetical protein